MARLLRVLGLALIGAAAGALIALLIDAATAPAELTSGTLSLPLGVLAVGVALGPGFIAAAAFLPKPGGDAAQALLRAEFDALGTERVSPARIDAVRETGRRVAGRHEMELELTVAARDRAAYRTRVRHPIGADAIGAHQAGATVVVVRPERDQPEVRLVDRPHWYGFGGTEVERLPAPLFVPEWVGDRPEVIPPSDHELGRGRLGRGFTWAAAVLVPLTACALLL